MAAKIQEDETRLLDPPSDSEKDNEKEEEVKIKPKGFVTRITTTSPTRVPPAADFPYSVEDVSSEGNINVPERKSSHFITRPERSKYHNRLRLICGIVCVIILLSILFVSIILIVTATFPNIWYRNIVIYQCYPQSFQDSNGDGFGDLNGITSRVNYFVELGVEVVWLNPIFDSPQKDNGYDVSNYTSIYSKYGTLDDFKNLVNRLHDNGIHILLDFVPNHTSDEHPWFIESRSSKTNPKRDWYVWADGLNDTEPPNNWISVFDNSSWSYDSLTDQWYLHQFSNYQPDLNYSNPEVREAMNDVLRFWLDIGVDGFRVDAVSFLLEDPNLNDEPENPAYNNSLCPIIGICYDSLIHNLTTNYHGIHQICHEWATLIANYSVRDNSQKILIAEIYNDDIDVVMSYYGNESYPQFTFPFNFFLLTNQNWTGTNVNCIISQWLDKMPSDTTANWVLGNHDNQRIATRAGIYRAYSLNLLLLTLPGISITYYGEEILMTDVYIPFNETKDDITYEGRDPERTPMQWNTSRHGGFTTGTPWLPLATNYTEYNVEVEKASNQSMLYLYKKILNELRSLKVFHGGDYMCLMATEDILIYTRHLSSDSSYTEYYIIAINFSNTTVPTGITIPFTNVELILTTYLDNINQFNLRDFKLRPGEGLVIKGYISQDSCQKFTFPANGYCKC